MKKIKGYKIMNPDMTCRGFKFEVGKVYKHKGSIQICGSGFHFCKELKDVYNYYSFDYKNPVFEIETLTTAKTITEGDKSVTDKIRILRQLDLSEVLQELSLFCNSNSGSYNRGSSNSGSDNRGSYNRGSDNRGSYNRGIFNFSSNNVGVFNYHSFLGDKENCYCFNEPTGLSMISFVKKYLGILREIKKYNFNNVYKLPNYSDEKWSLIYKHI